jgi:hypothetical protein
MAISAIVMNWFRPVSQAEAEKIAEAEFLKIPGAGRWSGRYRINAGPGGTIDYDQPKRYADGWVVVVSDARSGFPIMAMFLTPNGRERAIDFAPGMFYETASTGLPVK